MKRFTTLALMLLLSFILVACGASGTDNDAQTAEDEITEITVQFKWLHNPQFSGFYIADRNGFYQDAGLDVTLTAGGPGIGHFDAINAGEAQFAVVRGSSMLAENIAGRDFLALGATYQQNPYVYATLRDEDGVDPIQSAEDWAGLRVQHPTDHLLLFGILADFDLTFDDIESVDNAFVLGPLLDGEVDVMGMFLTDRARTLQEQEIDTQFIRPEDHGVLLYEDLLITTNAYANENPETVEAFVQATLRGWQHALENENEVVAAMSAVDASSDADDTRALWNATIPLLGSPDTLLQMDDSFFESTQALMIAQGAITESADISSYFTNEYLQSE